MREFDRKTFFHNYQIMNKFSSVYSCFDEIRPISDVHITVPLTPDRQIFENFEYGKCDHVYASANNQLRLSELNIVVQFVLWEPGLKCLSSINTQIFIVTYQLYTWVHYKLWGWN